MSSACAENSLECTVSLFPSRKFMHGLDW